jgi:hypothetical protein
MTSPSIASLHYEKRLKELGGIYAPGAHDGAIQYVVKEMGCTKEQAIEALRSFWVGGNAG